MNMMNTAVAAAVLCAAVATPSPAAGITPPIKTDVDVAYVSSYVWHGLVLNPDPAVQPSLTVSHESGLMFNFWGSADTTDVIGRSGDMTEMDYTLGYSWRTKTDLPVTTKVTYLTFPDRPITSFMRLLATTTFAGPLSPSVTVKYDFGNADGACATFGISKSVNPTGKTGAPGLIFRPSYPQQRAASRAHTSATA